MQDRPSPQEVLDAIARLGSALCSRCLHSERAHYRSYWQKGLPGSYSSTACDEIGPLNTPCECPSYARY